MYHKRTSITDELQRSIDQLELDLRILSQINKKFYQQKSKSDKVFLESVNHRVIKSFVELKSGVASSLKIQDGLELTTKNLLTCVFIKSNKVIS